MAKADGAAAVLEAIAEMPKADRELGERLHQVISESAPSLKPKLWYGQRAYANENGRVVCFFRGAAKDETRYLTLGFNDAASLDDGNLWATSYAVAKLTVAEEKKVGALVKKAVG